MTKTLHGVIHGRTIELADDPGLADGEKVVVDIRREEVARAPGDGIRRTAGALAGDTEWDQIMEEIAASRN